MKSKNKLFVFICLVCLIFAILLYQNLTLFRNPPISNFIRVINGNLSVSSAGEEGRTDIWFTPENPEDDRILSQLNYIPQHYKRLLEKGSQVNVKRILRYYSGHDFYGGPVDPGKEIFKKCPVNRCELTYDRKTILNMDAVMFEYDHPKRTWKKFPSHQIWFMYKGESPYISWGLSSNDEMNWTVTYRKDSTIVVPYYKFVRNGSQQNTANKTNYAAGKTKKVAMFVSHCKTSNNRMGYAKELGKYITVDIFGRCGTKNCGPHWSQNCFDMLRRDYKFYLSFENANCRHYITEKFFLNGLMHDTLPIAMGASPYDYKMAAPPNSYLHVDDFHSPKELAEYLHKLDKNDSLYNKYFKWKGTGYLVDHPGTRFWCRLCSLLHGQDGRRPSWYTDVNEWWRGKGICIGSDYWRNHPGANTSINVTIKYT